jgi:hypothetical protein
MAQTMYAHVNKKNRTLSEGLGASAFIHRNQDKPSPLQFESNYLR